VPGERQLFAVRLQRGDTGGVGIAYDPSGGAALANLVLEMFTRVETAGDRGVIRASPTTALLSRLDSGQPELAARPMAGEQSNTTLLFGREFMIKIFRQLEEGVNPDVEVTEFLWAHGYRQVPEPMGSVRYDHPDFAATVGIAQRFVPNDGTAWDATLAVLDQSLQRFQPAGFRQEALSAPSGDLLDDADRTLPEEVKALVQPLAGFATRLGERTAEMHLALSSASGSSAFEPEPFTGDYQRSMVRSARERVDQAFTLLARQLSGLSGELARLALEVFACREAIDRSLDAVGGIPVQVSRIRCHGDYHLGQVLSCNGDFVMLDFEGEPAQPLEIRRRKGSALYDVCGMLRSFHYAATVARQRARQPEEPAALGGLTEAWYRWTSALFLSAYLSRARASSTAVFLPESREELRALLRLHLIDKCSYELSYELNNRPAWVEVPMTGLLDLAQSH
jgi:maltose alpha-D-glucosyltransferase/alpha-amylase